MDKIFKTTGSPMIRYLKKHVTNLDLKKEIVGSVLVWETVLVCEGSLKAAFFVDSHHSCFGKILIVNNPRKWEKIIIDWCYMCKSSDNTVYHLLLHFFFNSELWSLVSSLNGVHQLVRIMVVEIIECRKLTFGHHNGDLKLSLGKGGGKIQTSNLHFMRHGSQPIELPLGIIMRVV